jgi:hypothetical protein
LFNEDAVLVGTSEDAIPHNHAQTIVGWVKGEDYQKMLNGSL